MKKWIVIVLLLVPSGAICEHYVYVATTTSGVEFYIDKDSIKRTPDGAEFIQRQVNSEDNSKIFDLCNRLPGVRYQEVSGVGCQVSGRP